MSDVLFVEGREPRRADAPRLLELLKAPDVHVAPLALRLSRRPALFEAVVVDPIQDAVDPTKAQRLVERFAIADAAMLRVHLEQPQDELFLGRVVLLEPLPEIILGLERSRSIWHRNHSCDIRMCRSRYRA